jgi:uncharacterized protein GlcG (DUF336 family)
MKSILRVIPVVFGIVHLHGIAADAGVTYGPEINLASARKIVAAAQAECQRNNWPVAVAVVDNHGFLVHFEKMDDTQTAGVTIAQEKARTAAMFRRPGRALEEGVNKGRASLLGLPLATPITGGLPVVVDGKIIGGVGVSGVQSEQDEQCAKAGLTGLK